MNRATELNKTRRRFLQMLSASPLFASHGLLGGSFANLLATGEVTEKKFLGWLDSLQQSDDVISSPEQAMDVMDFEPAARKALPPAHFGYLATGVDDDGTVRANREGYSRIQIRARRLIDVEDVDMSVKLFDTKWNTPIVLSPVSGQKAFHPEGEVAVARAAHTKGHLMMLSTVATSSIEDVIAARGGHVWQQLYPTNVWEVTRAIIKRAEEQGLLRKGSTIIETTAGNTGNTYVVSVVDGGTFTETGTTSRTSGFLTTDRNQVGLQTNENGALTVVSTKANTTVLIGQLINPQPGSSPGTATPIQLPANVQVNRVTWTQLR